MVFTSAAGDGGEMSRGITLSMNVERSTSKITLQLLRCSIHVNTHEVLVYKYAYLLGILTCKNHTHLLIPKPYAIKCIACLCQKPLNASMPLIKSYSCSSRRSLERMCFCIPAQDVRTHESGGEGVDTHSTYSSRLTTSGSLNNR